MRNYPGRNDRETARAIIGLLTGPLRDLLTFDGINLAPAAEHVLYVALRRPGSQPAPSAAGSLMRLALRNGVALCETLMLPAPRPHGGIVVFVTQPVHVTLFQPVAAMLEVLGERSPMLVAAGTGTRTHAELKRLVDADLRATLRPARMGKLMRYGVEVATTLRRPPGSWGEILGPAEARRLVATLRAALPRLAIDVIRVEGLIGAARPRVVACFSESGVLDRVTTATAHRHGVPVVDLPHAEAADPWGSAGAGYDAMAVYGARAADVLELAGVPPDRVVRIGPLRYDSLVGASASKAVESPPRVLFASQPVDSQRAHLSEAVKRLAIGAAVAFAAGANAAELIVLPHPTEDHRDLERLIATLGTPPGHVRVTLDPPGTLHDRLPGAFALLTASSQSVFEAVVAGVPAITVHPPRTPAPVTFADEGIALSVGTPEEARSWGRRLLDASERDATMNRARTALDLRIGPIDGRAAERAARWLHGLGR
jgi:hypothetical protein